jgi:hypothetical protein
MSEPNLTRRRWLAWASGGLALLWLAGWNWLAPAWGASKRRGNDDFARWHGLLRTPQSARAIGDAFLEASGTAPSAAELIAQLEAAIGQTGTGIRDLGDAQLRARLREGIRDDYAERRTVRVQGWVVSRTEAALCALHSVTPPLA